MAASMSGLRFCAFNALKLYRRTGWRSFQKSYRPICRKQFSLLCKELENDRYTFGNSGWLCTLGFFGLFKKSDEEDKPEVEDYGHLHNPVILLIKKGKIAAARGEYREAEMHYHAALRLNDDQLKSKNIDKKKHMGAVIYIYDAMANLALAQQEYQKAFILYKETIIGCLNVGVEKDSDAIVEISLKMASLYGAMGQKEEAMIGFDTCVEAQENKMSNSASTDTKALLGMIHQTYGRYLLSLQQYDKAQKHLERAEEVAIMVLGENNKNRVSILNDIATAQIMQESYQEGEKTLIKAAEIAEPVKMSELPAIYCNLGAISLRMSDLEAAHRRCDKGLTYARSMNQTIAAKEAMYCLEKVKEAQKNQ